MQAETAIEAKPTVEYTFSRGTYKELIEAAALIYAHYKEISHYQDIKLDPDHSKYLSCEERGTLRVYLAKDGFEVIGYCVFFVDHNMHYKDSLQAIQDVVYIDKNKRGFGRKFIAWCDRDWETRSNQ